MEASATGPLRPGLTLRLVASGGAALAAALLWFHPAHAALHRAALVIEHSSGRVLTKCVAFAESQISGLQLIQRSGVSYQGQTFGSMGSAICQLDGEPSSVPSNCFGSGPYWQYFHRQGASWQQSAVGAGSSLLHDGDMDGWHYAAGAAQPPASVAFATVCAAPAVPPPSATRAAQTSVAPALPAQAPLPSASPPRSSPAIEALAPSPSPAAHVALASTGPPRSPPSAHDSGPLVLFIICLLSLGALAVRSLSVGRGP